MRTDKKNLPRISIVVTAQTKGNLERLAAVSGYKELGRVVDKLTRNGMRASPPTTAILPTRVCV